MELTSTLEYRGYTIKTFQTEGEDRIKIYLGDDPVDYDPEMDKEYEGTLSGKKGLEAAKQYIDLLEEKENSL